MTLPRVRVVGLGPAGPELVTPQTQRIIDASPHRFVRTVRHPAAAVVADAASCDDLYELADTFDEVYAAIVERLVAAATRFGEVLYAVPGSPRVLERSVETLLADERVETEVVPAMSFLDLAWARLGVDPIESEVLLVDGHRFATASAGHGGAMLVAHCHNQRVLSDIKLAAPEEPQTAVTVLQRLGCDDEAIFSIDWSDLDREVDADHLTTVFIPGLSAPVAGELVRFKELVETLRRECPWDSRQTHESLRRHLVEEAYEVLDAIDEFDSSTGEGAEALEEELGDLLFQVFLHSELATEEGWFDLADVARSVHDKLYGRHPHIFGDSTDPEAVLVDDLVVSWEEMKLREKGRESVLDGIARDLPALSLAEKTLKKAGTVGLALDQEEAAGLDRRIADFAVAPDEDTLGAALLALVGAARLAEIDPEMALRARVNAGAARIRAHEASRSE